MAEPTVTQQRARLKTLLETVAGLNRVTDYTPLAAQGASLPLALPAPMEAEYDRTTFGAHSLLVRRQWEVIVLVRPAESGTEGAAEQAAEALIDGVLRDLAGNQHLTLDDGVGYDLILTGDSGTVRYTYASKEYAAVVFRMTTETLSYY